MKIELLKKMLVLGIVVLFIGVSVAPISVGIEKNISSHNWWDEDWDYCKEITINHDLVDEDLQDFTVLIHNISSDFTDYAQSDGDDFVFVSEDSNDVYSHEIEYYDSLDGELIAWVNIPYLDDDTDTILYIYYGNPTCDNQEDSDNTWDSDYIHVWHLGDSLVDSAGSNNGNNHGTDIVSGIIGKARDFEDNNGDYISFGDMAQPADSSLTTMTWEAWIKPETQDCTIASKYDTTGTDYNSYHINFREGGKFYFSAHDKFGVSGRTAGITDDSYSVVDQWVYLTASYELGNVQELDAFIDGEEVAFTLEYSNADYMRNTPVTDDLGRYRPESGGPLYVDAVIDEVRWSKVVRSAYWIKTSFNTMNDPFNFISVGVQHGHDHNHAPNQPSNPIPGNGAEDVDLDADISWICSDPEDDNLTYNVFFEAGDSSPDVLVSENQSGTSYDPGTMNYGTMYYWQIVAYDIYGASTDGPIWHFTTEVNNPPYDPSYPMPDNGETDVDLNADISWTCSDPDGHAILYDVYFGTSVPPPLVSNDQIETTYDPGILELCTIYHWQIVAKDAYGATTTGSIWNFQTRCTGAPDIPDINGPYNGNPGTNYTYTFVSSDPDDDDIFYQIDWGDGTFEDWFGPYDSDELITKEHIWDEQGNYTIKARAKDEFDAVGEWGSFEVSMPRTRIVKSLWYQWFLERFPLLEKLLGLIRFV
jgi:hypothetical protein